MDEELDNELVVNDVPETSENGDIEQVETSTSEGVEEVQEPTQEVEQPAEEEDIEKQIEERASKIVEEKIEARLARDRIKKERDFSEKISKYQQLESIMNAGLGTKNVDEAISRASEFYKEQGVNIPVYEQKATLNERDAIVLARADAQDIMKCGEEEMANEANRIAGIPRERRTTRENVMFSELCGELTQRNNIKQLKSKGYDTNVLEKEDFIRFSKDVNRPIAEVYEMYTKLHTEVKQPPKSPGSAKGKVANNEIKEFYTPEEVRKFKETDLDNPQLMKAIENSMEKWGKPN